MATRSKKPKCDGSTSQSCGMGCISREHTCRELIAADVATRLLSVAKQHQQPNDAAGQTFDTVAANFPQSVLKAAHKTGVATSDLGNGAVLTTKVAVGLDGSSIKYGFVTDADGKRYTVSDGLVKEVTSAVGSEWGEAFDAAVRSKVADFKTKPSSRPELPSDVSVSVDSSVGSSLSITSYVFSVSSETVKLYVSASEYSSSDDYKSDEVGFSVNDEYTTAKKMSKSDAAYAAIKLASIIKYEASTKPDGHKYFTNATTSDGDGYKRAIAYERLGFSRPVNAELGGNQFAVVVNGRLVPDNARTEAADSLTSDEIAAVMADNKAKRLAAKFT